MVRRIGFLCMVIAAVSLLSTRARAAEQLRFVSDLYSADGKSSGFAVEVLKGVFASMGQDATVESLPQNRAWSMVARGERDGLSAALRTSERERVCSFPDEPLSHERWVFFVRAADIGRLKYSSFDDLIGHDVAVRDSFPGLFEQPTLPSDLWQFLREHHNIVETTSTVESLRMLAAGRVDYAVVNLNIGIGNVASMGLSGKIVPLLSRSVMEGGIYVCFSKARIMPSLVEAFSRALKQFKQTEAYQSMYREYFP